MIDYLLTLFVVMQLIDAGTTYKALKNADLAEGNPAIAFLMKKLGVVSALVVIKLLTIGFIYWGINYTTVDSFWTLVALDCIYTAIVLNNLCRLHNGND